ncbi:hypothetical protein AAFF_G00305130 [Aldrovandia affinis]|uniref:Uncharacterized protein n=1 Tax=Aldrovandia affinis TaxID=143900 RepID=A0AAD7SQI9_9TELE|nr:hypothetical protein AAFF_G00305130 [Aldrovandia affinis]
MHQTWERGQRHAKVSAEASVALMSWQGPFDERGASQLAPRSNRAKVALALWHRSHVTSAERSLRLQRQHLQAATALTA